MKYLTLLPFLLFVCFLFFFLLLLLFFYSLKKRVVREYNFKRLKKEEKKTEKSYAKRGCPSPHSKAAVFFFF